MPQIITMQLFEPEFSEPYYSTIELNNSDTF